MIGRRPKVLEINLTTEEAAVHVRDDLGGSLGGSGLAATLFAAAVDYEQDALSPSQPIVMAIGPLTGIFPVITKVVSMFRSPLTGGLGESHAGMRLGMALRFAGYDAVLIKGRARRPVYLVISSRGVQVKPAGPLWGMTVEETGRILREIEGCEGHRSCLRIGPAGERLVRFAGVNVDTYRHFGRLGLGAVFGSKQLKGIVVQGDLTDFPVEFPREYKKVYEEAYSRVTGTEVMEKYHGLGTSGNVLALNELKALPTRNLQSSRFEGAKEISGEEFAEHNLLRKLACAGCPVGCIHLALHRTSFGSGQEYEFNQLAYDHELLYALGSMLGLASRQDVLCLIQAVEQAGLDAISTGVALAWATEALARGLITEAELGCRLDFGDLGGYLKAVVGVVRQESELYRVLALGTAAAAARYGGKGFALVLGGNEAAGYHTGYANMVGQAVGARHSHLDNAGYSLDQESGLSLDQLASKLVQEELERNVLTSLCICLFARKAYDFDLVERALGSVGIEWSQRDLYELGRRIFLQKRDIQRRLGFKQENVQFPRRFFETPSLNGMLEPWQAERLLGEYLTKVDQLRMGTLPGGWVTAT